MISKYRLHLGERRSLLEHAQDWNEFKDRFSFYYTSGFEHRALPVVTMAEPDRIAFLHWGLIPNWTKNVADAMARRKHTLNARSETVFELASFRTSIRERRCLIPATGFFEWRTLGKNKFPYHITVRETADGDAIRDFCFGGIYDTWVNRETAEVWQTFSVVTTKANDLLAKIHNVGKRMPLILSPENERNWLQGDLTEDQIRQLMVPYPATLMQARAVSKLITARGTERNVPEILDGFHYPETEAS